MATNLVVDDERVIRDSLSILLFLRWGVETAPHTRLLSKPCSFDELLRVIEELLS